LFLSLAGAPRLTSKELRKQNKSRRGGTTATATGP
jgi:hypothetical protein